MIDELVGFSGWKRDYARLNRSCVPELAYTAPAGGTISVTQQFWLHGTERRWAPTGWNTRRWIEAGVASISDSFVVAVVTFVELRVRATRRSSSLRNPCPGCLQSYAF